MMMLSQCATFGLMSKDFFDHWTVKTPLENTSLGESPATVSECDWREVSDMLDFQALVATFEVDDGVPNVVKTGIPLSVLISAHHNLVTYGVPFVNDDGVWTNPGPQKTFYHPKEAISALAERLDDMDESHVVQDWLAESNLNFFDNHEDVDMVPGMSAWVRFMRMNFFDTPRKKWQLDAWKKFHELARRVDEQGPPDTIQTEDGLDESNS